MTVTQVGVISLRDPVTGSFLPPSPLFMRAEDAETVIEPMEYDLRKLAKQIEAYRKEAARLEKEAEARKEARRKARNKKPQSSQSEQ